MSQICVRWTTQAGRWRYVLRPSAGCAAASRVELSGYGVEVARKKTEYKTGDTASVPEPAAPAGEGAAAEEAS